MSIFDSALTGVQTAANAVQGTASAVFQQLQNSLQGALNVIDSAIQTNSLSGFSISGLDTLKNDISTKIEEMETILANFAQNADPEIAFRGSYTGSIKTYLEEAKNVCKSIISYMGYYRDRIEVIKANIETRGSSMSSDIQQNATVMSEENVQAYQSKY